MGENDIQKMKFGDFKTHNHDSKLSIDGLSNDTIKPSFIEKGGENNIVSVLNGVGVKYSQWNNEQKESITDVVNTTNEIEEKL